MDEVRRAPELTKFVVEIPQQTSDWTAAVEVRSRLREAARRLASEAVSVRLIRVMTDPDDGSLLVVAEAPTRAAIDDLVHLAGLAARRIGSVVDARPERADPVETEA